MSSKSPVCEVNKKAWHEYEILDKLEAGIVLFGPELKSARQGGLSLRESYVQVKSGECYLVGAHIAPYKFSQEDQLIGKGSSDPVRDRKLLLHKNQIIKLGEKVKLKGLTLVPLQAYFNDKGKLKIEVGVGKGKKLHDKRQDAKNAESKRKLDRVLKQAR